MTRKDSEKDSERPHYYSQFWLDVAAGRRIIGAPRPNEEGEGADTEIAEPIAARRPVRVDEEHFSDSRPAVNGREESFAAPVAEPVTTAEEFSEPAEEEIVDQGVEESEEADYQDLPVEDTDIPDVDLGTHEEEEEVLPEEEVTDEEVTDEEVTDEEEEEEDDLNWGRGRKKPKPSRVVKQPPKKPSKREPRRGY